MTRLDLTTTHRTPNRCEECGATPLPAGARYCSHTCYRAAELRCEECGAFVPRPMAHRRLHHPEALPDDVEAPDDGTAALPFEPRPASYGDVPRARAAGEALDPADPRECNICGDRMGIEYARQWALEDGTLYCPECRPRTERYSLDPVIDRGN